MRVALFAMGSRWEGFLKLDKKKTKIGCIGPGATVGSWTPVLRHVFLPYT